MLRRFQISNNKSLDGVLDMLNSRWVLNLRGAACSTLPWWHFERPAAGAEPLSSVMKVH